MKHSLAPDPAQMNLFAEVLGAYADSGTESLSNRDLYKAVAARAGVAQEALSARVPVGESGERHNLFARRVRWYQQTLRQAGVIERVEGERGVWRLTSPANKELSEINPGVAVVGFSTRLGVAIIGSCDTVFKSTMDTPVHLVLTSPPYPLAQARDYGNPRQEEYVEWVVRTLEPIVKNLARGGSICLNVSNDIFLKNSPARSLYREELVLALCKQLNLYKLETFVWESNKPPGPIQWASLRRVHLNQAWEPVYWFTNDPHHVLADNRRVLQEHSERHLRLIKSGGEKSARTSGDGAYRVREGSFSAPTEGRIPRNVLYFSNNCADQRAYKRAAREAGLPVHGAPFPLALAKFFIEFMTRPGDLCVDPFGGSMTVAKAAELLGRRWITTDKIVEYVLGGAKRFVGCDGFDLRIAS